MFFAPSSDRWVSLVSISVFLFYSLMLSAPSGYSWGGGALALLSIAHMISCRGRLSLLLGHEEKKLFAVFAMTFVIALGTVILHGDSAKWLDQSSRYIFAIPILVLMLRYPPRIEWWWAGLSGGSITGACVAAWQVHQEGRARAEGFLTSAIPFGDIALVMGCLCVVGIFWARSRSDSRHRWTLLLGIGAIAAFYSTVLSQTRGAWIAVPVILALLGLAFINRSNIARVAATVGVISIVITFGAYTEAGKELLARYQSAAAVLAAQIDEQQGNVNADENVSVRLAAWRVALSLALEKPYFGWGQHKYDQKLYDMTKNGEISAEVSSLSNTHNNFIEVVLHQGLLGLVAFLALFAFSLRFFWRRLKAPELTTRVMASCGACLVTAFFMFSMTQVILGRNNGVMFFLITLTVTWALVRKSERPATCDE